MNAPAAFLVAWATHLRGGRTKDHFSVFRVMDYPTVDVAREAAQAEFDSLRKVSQCHSASLCEVLQSTDY